jgi:hypothetical protein
VARRTFDVIDLIEIYVHWFASRSHDSGHEKLPMGGHETARWWP